MNRQLATHPHDCSGDYGGPARAGPHDPSAANTILSSIARDRIPTERSQAGLV